MGLGIYDLRFAIQIKPNTRSEIFTEDRLRLKIVGYNTVK
jgi:hypothetical protein